MIYFISGEFIALVTFPGVMLHEIAHRLLCDFQDVSVYTVNYFSGDSKVAGHVIHQRTDSFRKAFYIGIAPLVINSIICMLLTIPHGVSFYFNTHFMIDGHSLLLWLQGIVSWVGFSAGFNAIPSDQDISEFAEKGGSRIEMILTNVIGIICTCFNLPYIGFWLKVGYAYLLSMVIPSLFL